MGADIHLFAEQKLRDGSWAMCQEFTSVSSRSFHPSYAIEGLHELHRLFPRANSRNYEFFAALAGVRGFGPDPKGLPPDVSPLVRQYAEDWDSDGHSHSWYSAQEFAELFKTHHMTEQEVNDLVLQRMDGDNSPPAVTILERYVGVSVPLDANGDPDLNQLRFVFWFDN